MNELPAAIRTLPGVRSTSAADAGPVRAAPAEAQPKEIVWEGSGRSQASKERTANLAKEFEADLKQNGALVGTLRDAKLPPDPRGLASVTNRANRAPQEFAAAVGALTAVVVSQGQNPAAVQRYQAAVGAFVSRAGVPRNELGDLSYVMLRLATDQQNSGFANVRQQLSNQVKANEKLIDALKTYEQSLQRSAASMEDSGAKEVRIIESDFRLTADNQVERIADQAPDGDAKTAEPLKPGEGDGTSAEGGKKTDGPIVPGVRMSTTQPPRVTSMNHEQLLLEIKETQMQIRQLQQANQALTRQMQSPPPPDQRLPNPVTQAILDGSRVHL